MKSLSQVFDLKSNLINYLFIYLFYLINHVNFK